MNNYTTIDEYISQFNGETKEVLQKTYEVIRAILPNSTEKISYGMPTFWQGENLIHFSALKSHLGIYPTPNCVEAFSEKLKSYKTSKGAIQFPYSKPIPYELIAEIAKFRLAEATTKRT